MRRAPTIKLDIPVRKELERLSRSRSVAVRLAERSRIVLLAAGGLDNQEIAAKLDITRQKAGRWRDRFVEDGLGESKRTLPAVDGVPRSAAGRRARIVKKTVEGKPPNATHWSRSLMARATGVSESTVGRIWRAHGLKPHLARTFKLSNDKQFVEKLEDVVGLYLNPPENAIVLSCDEKSQMQALDRTQPGLPLKKGRCGTLTHDYKRNGTTTMFAALNTLDGSIIGDLYAEASSSGMIRFLNQIKRSVPKDKQIHIICDNYATSQTSESRQLVEAQHALSCALHTDQCILAEHGRTLLPGSFRTTASARVFHSVPELIQAVEEYVGGHNQNPKPFIWTATGFRYS